MSDLHCDDCGEKLDWMFTPFGDHTTLCGECDKQIYRMSVEEHKHSDYQHLVRERNRTKEGKIRMGPIFSCVFCGSGGKSLKKISRKSNECLECGMSYPIYD